MNLEHIRGIVVSFILDETHNNYYELLKTVD